MLTDSFLAQVEAFLKASGMSAAAFGRATAGDPNLVGDLRNGRSPSLRLVDKVSLYMRDNAPAEAEAPR
jgi:hypothetical protein